MSITFMAKFNEREGNSCHIHCSLADDETGKNAFAADQQIFDRFLAGQLACMREMTLMFAPYVNSYKRFVAGLVRADRGRLGQGQPDLLAAGRRPRRGAAGREPAARRRRQPLPGAERDDRRRPARDRRGAARSSRRSRATPTRPTAPRVPTNLYDARDLFAASEVAREAFGEEVVDHYLNRARIELRGSRGRRHRLGALPGLRAACEARRRRMSRPVVGICAAVERARWASWDVVVTMAPQTYATAVQAAGGLAVILPPDRGGDGRPGPPARPARRPAARRRCRHRPRDLRRRRGIRRRPATAASATSSSWRCCDGRSSGTCRSLGICRGMQILNVALGGTLDQHLPDASAAATAIGTSPAPSATTRSSSDPGPLPPGRSAASEPWSGPTTTRASSRLGDGLGGERAIRRRRGDRGDRAAGPQVCARRPLAPRGGRGTNVIRSLVEAASAGGEPMIEVIEPATAEVMAELPAGRGRGGRRRGRRARRRRSRPGAPSRPATASRLLRALADALEARAGDLADARGPQRRQADLRRPRRDRDGRRHASATTRPRPSGCSARRSRSPAAST